jgi:hypothetical protein
MSKKKLLLSINDLKALGIIKKKHRKKHRKKKYKKLKQDSKYIKDIYGVKSESQHMVGFGSQINSNNDLQNELLRKQMESLQNEQNMREKQQLIDIEQNRFNRNEYYPRIQQLEKNHNLLIDQSKKILSDIYSKINKDNVDVAKTAGSDNFNIEGHPVPENDNINVNMQDYAGGSASIKLDPDLNKINKDKTKLKRIESLKIARMVRAQNVVNRKKKKEDDKEIPEMFRTNREMESNIAKQEDEIRLNYKKIQALQGLLTPSKI